MRAARRSPIALVLAFAAAFLMLAAPTYAQQPPTSIQQAASNLDAATLVGHSHTSAATITLTVPGGFFAYVKGIDITNCAGASAVTAATPTYITSTNFAGTGSGPQYQLGSGATAGLCQPTGYLPVNLKSAQPGVNVTFVLPTFATNQVASVNVYYNLVKDSQ